MCPGCTPSMGKTASSGHFTAYFATHTGACKQGLPLPLLLPFPSHLQCYRLQVWADELGKDRHNSGQGRHCGHQCHATEGGGGAHSTHTHHPPTLCPNTAHSHQSSSHITLTPVHGSVHKLEHSGHNATQEWNEVGPNPRHHLRQGAKACSCNLRVSEKTAALSTPCHYSKPCHIVRTSAGTLCWAKIPSKSLEIATKSFVLVSAITLDASLIHSIAAI